MNQKKAKLFRKLQREQGVAKDECKISKSVKRFYKSLNKNQKGASTAIIAEKISYENNQRIFQ